MKVRFLLAGTYLSAFMSPVAFAQTPDTPSQAVDEANAKRSSTGNILTEIVVTASRQRSEDVQETPVAVTSLNAAMLDRFEVNTVSDLQRIAPNVVIQRQFGTGNQATIYLRAFGNFVSDPAVDPPIALYVDGIYQPSSTGTISDLYGVERVEVERGPQGTLLGKNAPTGAISFTSRRPTGVWEGAAEASYERFDRKEVKGRIEIPVIDGLLAMNASLAYRDGGNYIRGTQFNNKRIFGGENGVVARVGMLLTPSDNFSWLIQANAQNVRNPQGGNRDFGYFSSGPYQQVSVSCAVLGYCTPSRRFYSDAGYRDKTRSRDRQLSSTMELKLTPVTLTAVTGFKRVRDTTRTDVDASPASILEATGSMVNFDQFSQEMRISSVKDGGLTLGGNLDWVLGAFYSNFRYNSTSQLIAFFAPFNQSQRGTTESYALFAHMVYNFTDAFNVTLGARQSWDNKRHSYSNDSLNPNTRDDPLNFKNFSIETGAQYKFSPDQNIYVRYAEGYRGGGYQGQPAGNIQVPYLPETVKAYEIGFKGDFLNKRLRTNISIFQNDYNNLQRTAILALPAAPFFGQFIANAANARVRGVELEATIVPVDRLTLSLTGTYLDPQYKNYVSSLTPGAPPTDNSNFAFPFASKYTAKFAPSYSLEMSNGGELVFNADATYTSPHYTSDVPFPSARVEEMVIVNAGIRYNAPDNKFFLQLYGQNLTNHHYIQFYTTTPTAPGGASLFNSGLDRKPITWGVSAGFNF